MLSSLKKSRTVRMTSTRGDSKRTSNRQVHFD